MPEKAWYQDGGVVFFWGLVAVGCYVFYLSQWEKSRPQVLPEVTGLLEQPRSGEPTLVLTLWHQHPGNLKNGVVTVTLEGEVTRGSPQQAHSFEVWEPNQDHAVTLRFPFRKAVPQQEIPVTIHFEGRGLKSSTRREIWLGTTWKTAAPAR